MRGDTYVLGIDFGTDSVRAIIVDAHTGGELSSRVVNFRRWAEGKYCDPEKNQFRQHPAELIESFQEAVTSALGALSGWTPPVRHPRPWIGREGCSH
jgi:L-ribulokinase